MGQIVRGSGTVAKVGRGDDTVGNPRRAQTLQFEPFELILLSKLGKQLPVEQFEATVSRTTALLQGRRGSRREGGEQEQGGRQVGEQDRVFEDFPENKGSRSQNLILRKTLEDPDSR